MDMTPTCTKCGKTAPIDLEKSTHDWIYYNLKDPCECGCDVFRPKCLVRKEDSDE